MKRKHDWLDDYITYSALNSYNSGGQNHGCSGFLLLIAFACGIYVIAAFLAMVFS